MLMHYGRDVNSIGLYLVQNFIAQVLREQYETLPLLKRLQLFRCEVL